MAISLQIARACASLYYSKSPDYDQSPDCNGLRKYILLQGGTHSLEWGKWLLTPFLSKLRRRETHFDQHLLQKPPALVMPGLQPDSHVRRVQHCLIQAPVAHQGEVIVIDRTATAQTSWSCIHTSTVAGTVDGETLCYSIGHGHQHSCPDSATG